VNLTEENRPSTRLWLTILFLAPNTDRAVTCVADAPPRRVHVEVAGDWSGRFTSSQPPPRLGLLAVGEGRLTPEIGPKFEWRLQTRKACDQRSG